MEELLAIVNKQLNLEFGSVNPKLEYYYGSVVEPKSSNRTIHGIIYLNYIYKKEKICYKLNRASIDSKNDPNTLIQHIEEVESSVKDAFINGLLFSKGSINIVELLSGRSEPLYILKVKQYESRTKI